MGCHNPVPATQDEQGYVQLRASLEEAYWENGQYLELACGHCGYCRSARARSWAIRAYHEGLSHTRKLGHGDVSNACFITLTYRDEDLPPYGDLDHAHWQNFAKKLRRDVGQFRFLQCGEYGAESAPGANDGRPHYHACIFGIDFHEDREIWARKSATNTLWNSEALSSCWPHGHANLAPSNFATAAYVAGYVIKKLRNAERDATQAIYGSGPKPIYVKKPEYINMSRGKKNTDHPGGLGHNWIEKNLYEVYPKDQLYAGGNTYRPPHYYDEQLRKRDPVLHEQVMENRQIFLDERGRTSHNELQARKKIFTSKDKLKEPRK